MEETTNLPPVAFPATEGPLATTEDFQALLEAMTQGPEPGGPEPASPGSPERPQGIKQIFHRVVDLVTSPLKGASSRGTQESSGGQERPKRTIARPQLYQAEEAAEKEREQWKKGPK